MHHLRAQDFSAWFCNVIRDDALAQSAATAETDHSIGFPKAANASDGRSVSATSLDDRLP
jgi:hypothetical protein